MILKPNTDKPHRCPACHTIPDEIWDGPHGARGWKTYTCPNGHRFALWRSPVWLLAGRRWWRLRLWLRIRAARRG